MFWEKALIVQPVSAFMNATEQSGGEVSFKHAGGDADIRRVKGCCKGVGGEIHAGGFEIIAYGLQNLPAEFHLSSLIVGLVEHGVIWF